VILGCLFMLAANGASILGAHFLLLRVRASDTSINLVLFLVIRLLLISGVVLAAGLGHCLTAPMLGLLGAAVVLGLLLKKNYVHFPKPEWSSMGWVAGAVGVLIGVRLMLQVWFFAPHTTDVLSYHLPKIAEWVQSGGFTGELGVDDHATFPAGFELIETWWVLFLHHDVLIEMAGVEFLVLGLAATWALAKRLGLSTKSASWAGLIYAMTPGIMLQATSCLNDGPVAALAVASFALITCAASWPLVGIALSLGVGVKATFAYLVPGMLLLAFLSRGEPRDPLPRRWTAYSLGAAGLLVGSFWYLRNVVFFGNPVYPIGEKDLPIQAGPRLSSLIGNLGSLINVRLYDRGPYGAYLDGIAGWGGVAFACGILGLLLWSGENTKVRKVATAFLVSLAAALLMSRGDDFYMRFCLFFPAVLAIAAVRLAELFPPVLPCVAIALIFQFLGTLLPYDLPLKRFEKLAGQPWNRRSASCFFGFEVQDAAVGYFASNRGSVYCLYGPDFSRRVVYLRSRSAETLIEDMKQFGLRTLCTPPLDEHEKQIVEACVRLGNLRRVSDQVLYRE
jgi:hypothetical protein